MSGEKNNDVFEEFEFKPLTDGLGFHQKSIDLKSEMGSQAADLPPTGGIPKMPEDLLPSTDSIPQSYAELTPRPGLRKNLVEDDFLATLTDEPEKPEIQMPLPRREQTRQPVVDKKEPVFTPQLDLNFKESAEKAIEEAPVKTTDLRIEETREQFKVLNTNMMSAIFDSIVAFTFSIIFLVAMITITKVDLVELIFNAKTQLVIQGSLAVMYVAILQLYLIISRVIGGATLGEWAFDVHVAEKDDRRGTFFALKVIARSLVSLATGFVVLPILSLVLRRDLAGRLSGTRLFQQV